MNTTIKTRSVSDDYFKLVRAFPLRPIRGSEECEQAGRILNRLLGRTDGKLSDGERDYVDALALLVQDYDRKHGGLSPTKRTPLEVLQYLTKEAGMGPTALGRVLGTTHALASLVLHGKRGISAANARILADYFKVDAGLFV